MKKMLIVGMTSGYGGKESFIMNVYHDLRHHYTIDFMKTDEHIAYEEELLKNGHSIFKVTPRRKSARQYQKDLDALMAKGHYDIVWVHTCSLSSISELVYAKKHHVPLRIVHAHSSQNTGNQLTMILHEINRRRITKYANLFFSCSQEASAYFYRPSMKVSLIQNGIDVKKYLYQENLDLEMRKTFGLEKQCIIGHVGRFSFEKNHTFLIDLFKDFHEKVPQSTLVLCGIGPLYETCQAYVQELGLSSHVLFLGQRKDIPALLQMFDFFVFPSVFEGLPFAPIEAQAAGVTCLISDQVSQDVIITQHAKQFSLDDKEAWLNYLLAHQDDAKVYHDDLLEHPINIETCCKHIQSLLEEA